MAQIVPSYELANLLPRLAARPREGPETFNCVLLDSAGGAHEVVCSTFAVEGPTHPVLVATFWDMSGQQAATRNAAALSYTASRLVSAEATLNEILADVARHAFEGSRALSAGIVVMGSDHRLGSGGGYGGDGANFGDASASWNALNIGPGEQVIEALGAGDIVVGRPPGKPVVLLDARGRWTASPVLGAFAETMAGSDWKGAVCVPVSWQNEVIGVLGAYLPAHVATPDEDELAFLSALADQAAMAVSNFRLTAAAARGAAQRERARLARELHDSVSQGLFSMTMQARAAQLSMTRTGTTESSAMGRSIVALGDLSRAALADMRALIFELRPDALAEEGLAGAVRKQAAAITARDALSVTVDAPVERLGLPIGTEEHLYRIVCEALHNVVKHASATHARVDIVRHTSQVTLSVVDDGRGFDVHERRPGHVGLSTMSERAEVIGADVMITSASGAGTRVELSLPV